MKQLLPIYLGVPFPSSNEYQQLFKQELFCLKFHDDLIQYPKRRKYENT